MSKQTSKNHKRAKKRTGKYNGDEIVVVGIQETTHIKPAPERFALPVCPVTERVMFGTVEISEDDLLDPDPIGTFIRRKTNELTLCLPVGPVTNWIFHHIVQGKK